MAAPQHQCPESSDGGPTMTPEAVAAFRSRIIKLRSASAEAGGTPTARSLFDALQAEAGWEAVSIARVKRLCAELNKAETAATSAPAPAAAAAAAPAAKSPKAPSRKGAANDDPETRLRPWPSSGPSAGEYLRGGPGCIFTTVEIAQSLGGCHDGRGSDEGDFGFRQALVEIGSSWSPQRRLFILQDEEQESAIVLMVRGANVGRDGQPVFSFEYASCTKRALNQKHLSMVQELLTRHTPVCDVSSSLAEQRLWLEKLQDGALPAAASPRFHPLLRRAAVAAPPPPPPPALFKRSSRAREPGFVVPHTCGSCGGPAQAAFTCGGCRGGMYCGTDCQVAHWKTGGHKAECRATAAAAAAGEGLSSVVIPAADASAANCTTLLNIRQGLGLGKTRTPATSQRNPHGSARFAIKCQLPVDAAVVYMPGAKELKGNALMIYDQPRELQRMLHPHEEPAYSEVAAMVRGAKGGFRGIKAFLWAKREGPMLRIYTDPEDMPRQDVQW